MSPFRRLFLIALLLSLASGSGAYASDRGGEITGQPYVSFRKPRREWDLTREFVQKTPDFSLEYGGKRVSPKMAGFIYHGERIEGDQLLLQSRHLDARGWVSLSAVVPVAEAEAYFSKEIVRRPADSFLFLMRGLTRFEKNDIEPALADLNEALRLDPKNVMALITRAVLWTVKNRPDQAFADANKAVELDTRNAYAFEQRAMIACSQKNDDGALRDFDRAIELGSQWVMIYVARGGIFLKRGELEKGQADLDHALQIDPKRIEAMISMCVIHMERSDFGKALAAINKAIQIDPQSDEAYSTRAVIHYTLGHDKEALKDLSQAVRLDPGNSMHYQNRAAMLFEKEEYASALADVESAIRLDPNNAEALHGRARLLATCPIAKIRNPEQAVISARRACELAGFKNHRYVSALAIAYSETGDFAAAVKWQQKAIDMLASNDPDRREYSKLLKRYQANKPYHRLGLLEEIGFKSPTVAAKTAGRSSD